MKQGDAATWVVIPAFNEAPVIGEVVAQVLKHYLNAVL
jgi:hypothetical protein